MSNLPRTIHLIAKTPGMNAKRLFKAIRAAHISIISIGYGIAVFDNITGFFRPTCPKIYCHHNVRSHTFCPFLKFIDSDFICLHRTPCKLHFLRTLFFWPGSIFPMVTRYKVTTRITNHRNVHLTDNLKNILAKSHIIGSLMSRLIDTMINGSSQMLNKWAVQSFVNRTDLFFFVCFNYWFHTYLHRTLFPYCISVVYLLPCTILT